MIAVAPGYPQIEIPSGWTREVKGPRIWLLPPEPGGRVVIAPLQARPQGLPPTRFLEMILLKERDRVPRLKQTKPAPFTSSRDIPGLIADVAALDDEGEPFEWRCYALLATSKLFGLMFAQIHPSRHDELRRAFLEIVKTMEIPTEDAGESEPPLEPWGEL
jgi:hypothetical protein